jgi:hypothetical protein
MGEVNIKSVDEYIAARPCTIRFALADPVPVALIGRIAKFRAKEVAAREKARATKAKG